MGVVQIIEVESADPDAIERLVESWVGATDGRRTAQRAVLASDPARPGTYLQLVEFASDAAAKQNSELPETVSFAEQLREICAAPPAYRDLEVRRTYDLT